jgi:hypothetical protein
MLHVKMGLLGFHCKLSVANVGIDPAFVGHERARMPIRPISPGPIWHLLDIALHTNPHIYYAYIRITHYQSFNVIVLTCKLSTSSTVILSTNLYLSYLTGSYHLSHHLT